MQNSETQLGGLEHGRQHPFVPDPTPAELPLHHQPPPDRPIHNLHALKIAAGPGKRATPRIAVRHRVVGYGAMQTNSPTPGLTTRGTRLLQLLGALVVLAYFLRYCTGGLSVGFAADDPWNIHYYWSRGVGQLLRNLVLFFTTYYRPMGGVYFSVLHHFFGLNALPYHVVAIGLLLLNTFLTYRFATLITGSRLAGWLCAFLLAFHAGLVQLLYLPCLIFDILCFTFYFLAFNYYLSIRMRGAQLTKGRIAVFLLLYIGALESKEMAVTLPALLLLYEAFWHPPERWSPAGAVRWAKTEALTAVLAGLVTVVYALGKALGSNSLLKAEAYRPVFTVDRYFESTARFMNTLSYRGFFNAGAVILMAALLLAIAWGFRQRRLFLMWFFIFITPLPITFLPGRGGASLYIPLVGWAVFGASVLLSFGEAVAKSGPLRRVPVAVTQGALIVCAVAAQWAATAHFMVGIDQWVTKQNQPTASVIRQIPLVQPSVKPGSTIYVMQDKFYDMMYLFELTYHDHSVHVLWDSHEHLKPAQIEQMDYVFTFENGVLKRLKGT
jgi:hypothetical protein